MIQSPLQQHDARRLHVAVIMDGNGRWAALRGLPRTAGHRAGAAAVRRAVEAAPKLGVSVLTLYAFSSDNWQRPRREVWALMRLLDRYLRAETPRCVERGVRVEFVGRRDRLPPPLREAAGETERATADGSTLRLRLAVDYSARDQIVRAASACAGAEVSREAFARLLGSARAEAEGGASGSGTPPAPDVDLLIRTGGEQRLSDFLLWESAYAELYFTRRMWPDFDEQDFARALEEFHARERRFGRVLEAV
ncbi:MAG TPA: di-trans,poly-cis-decaprenylcistransferase [Pyrinomonadaceae bacterium]|nr:di-trans,poly-cis-decaprenylcistransferase [Pyrinomonadaceae bacterium]